MRRSLQDELKQTKPWGSLEEEATLNITRTAAVLEHALAQVLKPFAITPTQYNVLRILRGAGEPGLCRNEVGDRLIRRVPDVTRLLDRMEQVGWIERRRGGYDRRFVTTHITGAGLVLLEELDNEVRAFHAAHLQHFGKARLQALIGLLEDARSRC